MFLYVPSVERAYQSVKDIEYVVTFGWWIRAVHRIGAHLMVVAVVLHLARVFFTGAYKNGVGQGQRREWNWVHRRRDAAADAVPVVHRLPAAVGPAGVLGRDRRHQHRLGGAGASGPAIRELLIGGRAIEQATLIRFYVLHVIVLPGALGVLFAYHMWRIRKDGGLANADAAAVLDAPRETGAGRRRRPTRCWAWRGARRRRFARGRRRRRI